MRVHVSGDRNGAPWPPPGSVMELPDAEAAEYCAAGMADPVTDFKAAETAVAPVAEERAEKPSGLTKKTGPRSG
jgi:hypothetical protein